MSRDWELKESKVWYILTRQAVDYLRSIKARGIRLPRALFGMTGMPFVCGESPQGA